MVGIGGSDMKTHYEEPEFAVIYFESEDEINSSSDYNGIDFMDLI